MWSTVSLNPKDESGARRRRGGGTRTRRSPSKPKSLRRHSPHDEVGELLHAVALESLAVAGLIHEQAEKIKSLRIGRHTPTSIRDLIELDKAVAKCLEEVNQKERQLFERLRLVMPFIQGGHRR